MASIKSKKIIGPDGTTKTVQIGSKADTKYAGMGYKDVDTGIQLPSAPSLANQAGGTAGSNSLNSLLSSSSAARSYDDVEREVRAEMKPGLDRDERRYNMELSGLTQEREGYGKALKGQLGTNRRFSTSASAFIQKVDDDFKEKIEKLEMQRQDAIESGDARMISAINSRLQAERAAWREEQDYNLKLFDRMQAEEDRQRKEMAEDPFRLAGRTGAIIDLYQEGIDDPAEIFQTINYDESGRQVGDISLDEITTTLSKFENDRDDIKKIVIDLGKSGAPANIIDLVSGSKSLTQAVKNAGEYLQSGSGIVGEYQFYKRDAQARGLVPVSFDEYQNIDANRKKSIAAAANAQTGLTPTQTTTFLRVTDKFQADKVMDSANKGKTAIDIANRVIADPSNAGGQLSILYTLVKSLDPDSAVREGEIALASQTQSYFSRFGNSLERIGKGKVISDDAAKVLAEETKKLASSWYEAGQRREKQYKAQANTAGIGEAFNNYLGNFERPYAQELIEDEENAQARLGSYIKNNPIKSGEIAERISIMEEELGGPVSAEDFLQAFPEYK